GLVLACLPLRVDQERIALRQLRRAEGGLQHAVLLRDLLVGVREDREGQAVLLRERLVRLDVVDADAEDLRAGVAEGEDVVAELTGPWGRSTPRPTCGDSPSAVATCLSGPAA